ncbi:hypothetical protein QTG54_010293 [Skeletonema marinoi]|uniref:HMG box domain-containing protein n=1 Tax=Skeletonema marinoi TaxID=267567 RepID=A0AAD8Y3U9_9STRA|nr:hypothetical protein QTG54_010293 [Skeletonema marinoi]
MAPTLTRTEAEEPKSDQRRQPRTSAMNASRISEEARQDAATAPANVQTQRVDDITTPATHHASEDAHDHVATELTTHQHENQATVPNWWSRFVSPVWRMVRTTQPPQIPDYQMPQSEALSLLGEIKTAQDQILEHQQALKTREEEFKTRMEEFNATVEELQEVVGQGFAGLLRNELPKVIKQELRRKQVKEEKAAGKPKKNCHMYNIHVSEERKRLKELGPVRDLFQVASRSWGEMSEEERMRQYGDIFTRNKERYERELEGWRERRRNPDDEKKPAAKPTPEELAATAATDHSQEPHQPPHEEPIAAAAGPGASDEGYQLSPYEQMVQDKRARNQENMRRLGLLSTTASTSNATSKKRKKKKRKNTSDQPARQSPRKLSHNLLGNDRSQDGSTELQCPVGYRFIRSVPPSNYRDGYDCEAEVVEVDGDCEYLW